MQTFRVAFKRLEQTRIVIKCPTTRHRPFLTPPQTRSYGSPHWCFPRKTHPYHPLLDRPSFSQIQRHQNELIRSKSDLATSSQVDRPDAEPRPEYQMTFTCKKCQTRSTHKISKQGYHNGTVLVQCPGCKNRHLIADHLKIFSDERITVEDMLAKKGEELRKAHLDVRLSNEGVVEVEPKTQK